MGKGWGQWAREPGWMVCVHAGFDALLQRSFQRDERERSLPLSLPPPAFSQPALPKVSLA